jgi:hypothetical protein
MADEQQQRQRALLRARLQAGQNKPAVAPVAYTSHQKRVLIALRAQIAALEARQRELKLQKQAIAQKFWHIKTGGTNVQFDPIHLSTFDTNFDIELVGAFPELTYCPLREFNFGLAGCLSVNQDVSDVGGTVWDASIIMAHYLNDLGLSQIKGARLLELGAGTGIPGIVAARLQAERVVFTELPTVVPITEQIVMSHTQDCKECKIEFYDLIWGTPLCKLPWVTAQEPFDIIVGADVLYRDLDELFDSIVSFMAPNTVLFLAYERRHIEREARFFAKFDDSWDCEILSAPMLDHCNSVANVVVQRCRKRKIVSQR